MNGQASAPRSDSVSAGSPESAAACRAVTASSGDSLSRNDRCASVSVSHARRSISGGMSGAKAISPASRQAFSCRHTAIIQPSVYR